MNIHTHSSIIVQMNFNVAADNTAKCPHKIIDLPRVSTPDGIGDTNSVDSDLIHGLVDAEEIDEVGSEGVF